MDVQNDGFVILMNEDGSTKEDLKLPETEDDFKLVQEIRDMFDAGKYIFIFKIKGFVNICPFSYGRRENCWR